MPRRKGPPTRRRAGRSPCKMPMDDAAKGTKVFIGNLPPDAEGRDIREFFRDYGQVNDAWVARKPPGFGFAWFDSERDARDAVRDLDGRDLLGNRVRVELSVPRGAGGDRRGGGGGRGGGYGDRGGYGRGSPDRRGSPSRRSPSPRRGRDDSRSRSRGRGGGGGRSPRARSPFKERDDRRRSRSGSR